MLNFGRGTNNPSGVFFPVILVFQSVNISKKQLDETNIMFKHLQMTCQNKKQGGIHHKPCKPFEP